MGTGYNLKISNNPNFPLTIKGTVLKINRKQNLHEKYIPTRFKPMSYFPTPESIIKS